MKLIQYYILLLFTLIALTVRAQLYPVQVVPTVNAPYSSKLADYANPLGGRMQLQLITTDLNIQNRSVQLHLEIKGNGLKAQSLSILNVRTLRISGGEITSLSQSDLAPYFKPENLQGLSMQQYAQPLPDGVYSFCWRVRDVQSGKWLSGSQCATIYLMLNDPPQLNLPTDNERVAVGNFPNIIFSWTPRHLNATNVTYEFELCELLDPSLDPRFAFEVSRKVLKESDLRMTTLLYDLSKPNLIPGHRYGWRVRAVSTAGLVQNSVFKNDGYSEVHSFVYASDCKAPWGLVVTEESPARIRLQWQGDSAHRQYHIQYRKANVVGAEWFDTNTKGTEAYLTDLEGGETYEARVGASCELPKYGTKPSYTYGAITRFEVKKSPTAADNGINCGAAPEIKITDRKPLASLVVNETFTANDFTVKVLEVSGGNGIFTGKGYIEVPFLANAKLAVSFNNVQINSSHQLIGGVVEADYDKKWGDVNFAENLTGEGKRSQKTLTVSFEIERVETNEKGELVAVGKDGRREVFPGGKDTVITDSTGKVHYINQKGEISEPQILAQGGKPTKENTDGVNKRGEATKITAKGIKVSFENAPNSKYAFDKPTKAEKPYEKIEGKPVPYKAVAFGATEPFIAKVSAQGKEVNIDSLFFKTNNGTKIEAKRDGNNYILQLKGLQSFAVEQVQATIKQGKKYKVAGVFNLVHITPRTVKITLVPTSVSVKLSEELISRIKEIYTPIAVDLDIAKGSVFDISSHLKEGKLPSENAFGDLSTYSPEQNAIIADYKKANNIDNQQYYVFVTDVLSTSFQEGYMRINGQFGFITPTDSQNTNSIVHTIAHELGHGIFALSHPFKHTADKGKTALLMDYSSGVAFSYPEWKAINDPKVKLYAFQKQSEGEYNANAHLGLTPDGVIFDTFFLNGKKINTTIEVAPDKYTIQKISYQGYQYYWDRQSKAFVGIGGIEGAIKVKREAKNINNKVNIYRSRKDGCTYDYLTIPWETKDEQSTDIVQTIEKYIAQYNESYWRIAPYTVRDASCGKKFFTYLRERDLQECSTAEINEGRKILQGLLAEVNPERVTLSVNNYCMAAILGLTYGEIEKLFDIIASQERITEHSEVALLRLMSGIKTTDYKRFYAHLEANGNKLLKHLIEEIDDASVNFLTDKKNYTNFIGALVWMFNHNPASIEDRWGKNEEDFTKITLNLDPIGYDSSNSKSISTYSSKYNEAKYIASTGKIELYDVYKETSIIPSYTIGGAVVSTKTKRELITEVSPLTPLIIVPDKDKLPLLQTALEGNNLGNEVYIVPAIFLKYGNDKIRNDYIEKGVITTLDVATIALSGGTALATKVHWVRRAWALAEVVGAVGDIGVNVSQHIDPNSSLGQVVNSYNLAMGVIGIKNLGQAGYKFAKNLPQATKNLLQKNGSLRAKLISYYQKWQTEVAQLDNSSQAEKQLVEKQAEVWKALGFENKIDDIASLVSKWDDLSREEILRLYNSLSKTNIVSSSEKVINQRMILDELNSIGNNFINPYSFTDEIIDIVLKEDAIFIRAFSEYQTGRWMLSLEEFKKINSVEELVKKTALPLVDQKGNIIFPNKLALVRVPKGTTIRKSVARPQDWGGQGHLPGGAIQFEIRDFNWKTMENWFKPIGKIEQFIKK